MILIWSTDFACYNTATDRALSIPEGSDQMIGSYLNLKIFFIEHKISKRTNNSLWKTSIYHFNFMLSLGFFSGFNVIRDVALKLI